MKNIMLIADDNEINRGLLTSIFEDSFEIVTACDGRAALNQLRYYGAKISIVLLDLVMPEMDGFAVLEAMQNSDTMRSIPVIVVSGLAEQDTGLKAIRLGAADFIFKPVEPDLVRIRVASAVSKAENARLRAENEYYLLQKGEQDKYRIVLESAGTVVIEYDRLDNVFKYDPSITNYIAGNYNERRLWHILTSDQVADAMDVKAMQKFVYDIATDKNKTKGSMNVKLKTPSGEREWFRMSAFKQSAEAERAGDMIMTFHNVNSEVESAEKLRFRAEREPLTKLFNRETFFKKAADMLAAHQPGYYIISCFDIEKFKLINDQYGNDKGDAVLCQIADIVRKELVPAGGIACRISADNFAAIYPVKLLETGKLEVIAKAVSVLDGSVPPLSFSIGRYLAEDLTLTPSAMYDRADLAKASVKGRYDAHIAWYDESMRDRLIREQAIVNEMRPALELDQFEVWLQPQYNHATRALIGAEALVRWRHPARGIVSPAEFIPVFERNGFIYEMDKHVWGKTCALLRKWLDEGHTPLPLSVNISRYDIFRADLVETITGLIERYRIPVGMLRLEITESTFSTSAQQVVHTVKSLIEHGFTVEIDDFGSGYSSLNTLKDVPAQILKLDMRFLENSEDSGRGGNVLESVVRMAKWLGMAVIAEGVETVEQADFLKSIGCNYMQGYLYAKPMPVCEYEALAKRVGKEQELLRLETVENLNNNAFWDPRSTDTLIFNSYVGAASIVEYQNGKIELLRASEKFLQMLSKEGVSAEDAQKLNWLQYLDEDSARAFCDAVRQSVDTKDEVTVESVLNGLPGCSKKIHLRVTLRVIAAVGNRFLLYCLNENITQQREIEEKERAANVQLKLLNKMLQTMMDDTPGGFARLRAYPDGGVATEYVNDNFCRMRGLTREEIMSADQYNALGTVHPEDVEMVRQAVREMVATGETRSIVYRLKHAGGTFIPFAATGRVTVGEDGMQHINVYYTDVPAQER